MFSRELRGLEDLAPAFDDAKRAGSQAAIFMTDNAMFGHRKQVAELSMTHLLPTIHSFPPEVRDGGLLFYGPSSDENYQRAAALADKILKGARPSELPVEQPTKFELIINLKTAKALAHHEHYGRPTAAGGDAGIVVADMCQYPVAEPLKTAGIRIRSRSRQKRPPNTAR